MEGFGTSDRESTGPPGRDSRREYDRQAPPVSSGAAVRALLREPVVGILFLAGIFDGISGNPVHSVLLFSAALALAWDAVQPRPLAEPLLPERVRGGRALALGGVAMALAYATVVGGFPRYSWQVTVSVVVPGAIAIILAWRGPLRERHMPNKVDAAGALAWVSVFVALALWELTQLLLQPSLTTDSYAHPTISVLTDPALATHPGRSIALFVWLCSGWWLLRR